MSDSLIEYQAGLTRYHPMLNGGKTMKPPPTIRKGALISAQHAYLATIGEPTPTRIEATVWAYLWACDHTEERDGITYWPSLTQLRAAMRERA